MCYFRKFSNKSLYFYLPWKLETISLLHFLNFAESPFNRLGSSWLTGGEDPGAVDTGQFGEPFLAQVGACLRAGSLVSHPLHFS